MGSENDGDLPKKSHVTMPARIQRATEQHYQRTRARGNSMRLKSGNQGGKAQIRVSSSESMNDLSLSLSINEKYDPQPFEETLRKTFNTKFDEELHKIKERTAAMLRNDDQASRYHQEFEERRAQDMSTYQKRIPKLAIIHRIERVHRSKCPSFNIDSCLAKKTYHDLSENATRQEIRIYQEKKIDQQLARMNNLEKQQSFLKQTLTPDSKNKLGLQPIILPSAIFQQLTDQELEDADSEYYDNDADRQSQQQFLIQSQSIQYQQQQSLSQQSPQQLQMQFSSQTTSQPLQQSSAQGFPATPIVRNQAIKEQQLKQLQQQLLQQQAEQKKAEKRAKPENRHNQPCNMSFHDDEIINRQSRRSVRSFSTTQASFQFAKAGNSSNSAIRKRQQAMIHSASTAKRNNFLIANTTSVDQQERRRTESSFYQATSPFSGNHSLSQTKIEIEQSIEFMKPQRKSSPSGGFSRASAKVLESPSSYVTKTESPTVPSEISRSPELQAQYKQRLKQTNLELKRQLRKCSPLNFLFNKYSSIIQEGNSSNRQMRSLQAIYITNQDPQMSSAKKSPYDSGENDHSPLNFYTNMKSKNVKSLSSSSSKLQIATAAATMTGTGAKSAKKSKQKSFDKSLPSPNQKGSTGNHPCMSSKDLLRTLLELKKEQIAFKQQSQKASKNIQKAAATAAVTQIITAAGRTQTPKDSASLQTKRISEKRETQKNIILTDTTEQISPYDNLFGQYNVSDFLKKVVDKKKQTNIENERIAKKNPSYSVSSTNSVNQTTI